MGNSPEEPLSEIPAPGEENERIGKLAQFLTKHQANMAGEETSHKETMADLESQLVNFKALMAREVSSAQAKAAANEELLSALRAKVRSLTASDHHIAAINHSKTSTYSRRLSATTFSQSGLRTMGSVV